MRRSTVLLAVACCVSIACGDEDRPSPGGGGTGGAGANGGSSAGGTSSVGGSGNGGSTNGGSAGTSSAGTSNGGSAGSANGGSGGTSNGGSSTGGSSTGGSSNAGQGGSAGNSTGGSGGPGIGPCIGNKAWGLTVDSWDAPTPSGLISTLQSVFPQGDGLTVVLHLRGATGPRMATSTIGDVSGIALPFWTPSAPTFTSGQLDATTFSYTSTQASGFLRVVDDSGEQFIALDTIDLSNGQSANSDCSEMTAIWSAHVPASEGSRSLTVSGSTSTWAALAGSSANGWSLQAHVTGSATEFSFDDL